MLMFMFLCGCVDADVLDMGGGGKCWGYYQITACEIFYVEMLV